MHGHPRSIAKLNDIRVQVEAETERMLRLARTVGKRLRHQLNRGADTQSLLDPESLECAKWYSRCVIELKRFVASQPDQPDQENLSDADFAKECRLIAAEQLRGMTPAERREWIQGIEQETTTPASTPSVLNPAPDRWHE